MSAESLSPSLQQFIARYVRSVEQVEILCLLAADPTRKWTVAEVFRTIQSSAQSVTDSLELFRKEGFLVSERAGTYQYSPKAAEIGQGMAELAKAYRERRVTVIHTIYMKPADTIQDFADAFKLRKDK